jgi:hypothetical protein
MAGYPGLRRPELFAEALAIEEARVRFARSSESQQVMSEPDVRAESPARNGQ